MRHRFLMFLDVGIFRVSSVSAFLLSSFTLLPASLWEGCADRIVMDCDDKHAFVFSCFALSALSCSGRGHDNFAAYLYCYSIVPLLAEEVANFMFPSYFHANRQRQFRILQLEAPCSRHACRPFWWPPAAFPHNIFPHLCRSC